MPYKDPAVRAAYNKVRLKQYHREQTLFYQSYKNRPCLDCGRTYPPYVMDFDHRIGEDKLFCFAIAGPSRSKKVLLEEMAKCDLVCSNCHRIRTHVRKSITTGGVTV